MSEILVLLTETDASSLVETTLSTVAGAPEVAK
jgi:hypothetical protein